MFKISLSLVCVLKKSLFVEFLTLTFCNNVTMCVLSFLSGREKNNSWIKMVKNNKLIIKWYSVFLYVNKNPNDVFFYRIVVGVVVRNFGRGEPANTSHFSGTTTTTFIQAPQMSFAFGY